MKPDLFQRVECSGYMKKIYDGKYIEIVADEAVYMNANDTDFEVTSECSGDLDFLKTYYEHRQRNLKGVVVGYRNVVVTGYLVAETICDFAGRECIRISKVPKDTVECAVVYYANNKKSLVPIAEIKDLPICKEV